MCLIDYILCNSYQPLKHISKFDEKLLVATLSQIQTDAEPLQNKKLFQLFILIIFLDYILDMQTHITRQPNHDNQTLA